MSRPVSIAVDVVGGDFAPKVALDGIRFALSEDDTLVLHAVGPCSVVEPFIASLSEIQKNRVIPAYAEEVIEMGEHPANAVRAKKDSSIVVGSRLVKEGVCDGFYSAGSTGACMAAATLVVGRIKGVNRPALATLLPSGKKTPTILLDVGANADCKPQNLLQFALMGQAYAQSVFDIKSPTVGLLNIGEEEAKGSQLAQDAYALMKEQVSNFEGNVEGRDVLAGKVDVIVTDGFTGNVALKLLEGTTSTLLKKVKNALTSSFVAKMCALPLLGNIRAMRDELDPDKFGGAPLLGVKGVCAIGHGSSNATAIKSGILITAKAARNNLADIMAQSFEALAETKKDESDE